MYKKAGWKKLLVIPIIAGLVLLILPNLRMVSVESIVANTPASLPLAMLSFLLFFSVKSVVIIIPITILYVSAGIVFPNAWPFIIAYVGVTLTLSIGYFNGRRLGEEKVEELIKKSSKLGNFMEKRRDNLTYLCFFSRLSPFPFDIFSFFSGAIKVPFAKYLVLSLLGLTPKLVLFVFTGITISRNF
jgi:uncharacterized membrane protein YdjX (TVP38/TMEM64 family)